MKKISWYLYGVDYVLRHKCEKLYRVPYCHRKMYSAEAANNLIYDKLMTSTPFFAGRIGLFEMAAMRAYEFHNTDKYEIVMKQIYDCAGFFPYDINLGEKFLAEMKDCLNAVDILACSNELDENYFINHYARTEVGCTEQFTVMESWRFSKPWSAALRGKRVLIVSPFEESIYQQYQVREKLFPNTDILPEFSLITYKSLQTTGDLKDDRFSNWFEALEYMYQEIKKIDFDVALLGCGAYGFPLAARIKNDGKQAVHMGGVLQILFGIMGKRWDGTGPNSQTHRMREDIEPYYNEYWTYPKNSEKPISASKVEYGPYWR